MRTRESKIIYALCAVVSVTGAAVMAGWVLDITAFKSVTPYFVTMKFSTALCFFVSGIIISLVWASIKGRKEMAQLLLAPAVLINLLIMTTLASSTLIGIETGVEGLFIKGGPEAVMTPVPGRPSIMTMLNFVLIGACGIASMLDLRGLRLWLLYTGYFILLSACVALAGYALGIPPLYYATENYTAMALHTAFLFSACAVALILISMELKKRPGNEH